MALSRPQTSVRSVPTPRPQVVDVELARDGCGCPRLQRGRANASSLHLRQDSLGDRLPNAQR